MEKHTSTETAAGNPELSGEKVAMVPVPVEQDRAFIVSSRYGWARAGSIRDALNLCKQNNPRDAKPPIAYFAMLVHKETVCDGLGGVTRPQTYPPLYLGRVA
jgi:hypothetical protein